MPKTDHVAQLALLDCQVQCRRIRGSSHSRVSLAMNKDRKEARAAGSSHTVSLSIDVRFFCPMLYCLASAQCYLAMLLPSRLYLISRAASFIYVFNPEQ